MHFYFWHVKVFYEHAVTTHKHIICVEAYCDLYYKLFISFIILFITCFTNSKPLVRQIYRGCSKLYCCTTLPEHKRYKMLMSPADWRLWKAVHRKQQNILKTPNHWWYVSMFRKIKPCLKEKHKQNTQQNRLQIRRRRKCCVLPSYLLSVLLCVY